MILFSKKKKHSTNFNHLHDGLISPLNLELRPEENISKHTLDLALKMRGPNRPPALILHGVTPRCGSVYCGEVLKLHSNIFAYPNNLWELPFLTHADDLISHQEKFFLTYPQNKERMGKNDPCCLFGAGMMSYLNSFVPETKNLLIKIPRMQFLNYFFTFFPYENLILLMRDGRDVVHSTIKTWPDRDFLDTCSEWSLSAQIFLHMQEKYKNSERVYFVKFEEFLCTPVATSIDLFKKFNMNPENFHPEAINNLPIRGSSSIKQNGKVTWTPVEKPSNFNPSGKWNNWSKKWKTIFKDVAGQTLIDCGYCSNFDW